MLISSHAVDFALVNCTFFFGLIFLTSERRYSRRDGAILSAKQVLEFGWSGLLSSGW
ncbi:hypothetical protein Spb1_25460 [Planctopirus ephydatiae]|uniref:Uncharacterized protein n=1 Tax=Planctopirus ephydatiae TaxID=2528019 RepID=A0A518GPR5_9PLAN|nr:hypothetical protein Spb1_25460 [Planctopirus ephydatiae]